MMLDKVSKNNKSFSNLFSSVFVHQNRLGSLNTWWDKVSLVGKINSLNVPQSLLGNMLETKAEFAELQDLLIDNLINEQFQQYSRKAQRIAQAIVEIPNRNLFERTADVGFLATDAEVIEVLSEQAFSEQQCTKLNKHFLEYAAKYSVYDEIMLFDAAGRLQIQMTTTLRDTNNVDPIIAEVLKGGQDYWEVCRFSSLLPEKVTSSLFLAPIKSPHSNQTLGVLCLSFKLEDEMQALFNDLEDNTGSIYALLDAKGKVIVSNNTKLLPVAEKLRIDQAQKVIRLNEKEYFASVADTSGYQGYLGLGWRGCVLLPLDKCIENKTETSSNNNSFAVWKGFSTVLSGIQHRAKIVTEDLDLVVLNGRIAAARSDADEFIPILEEIRVIGRKMQEIFSGSVDELMTTALSNSFSALTFQASQAIDIMDRNLYERANDCRWWALTNTFIDFLSNSQLSQENNNAEANKVLAYINSLYTVYSGLYLYDKSGKILSVSTTEFAGWVGSAAADETNWKGVLTLKDPQQYCVSTFTESEYYSNRPTYIYNAAIRSKNQVLGGIGIVFDSEPQFKEMLEDVLGDTKNSRYGIFVDRKGYIISCSQGAPWQIGQQLHLPNDIAAASTGCEGAGIYSFEGSEFIVGYAVSKGYREFKNSDCYTNDVIAIIAERNQAK